MRSAIRRCIGVLLGFLLLGSAPAAAQDETLITFFYGEGCPHCAAEEMFLDDLTSRYPGVRVERYEVWHDEQHRRRLADVAARLGFEPTGVPVTLIGDRYWIGFGETTAAEIEVVVQQSASTVGADASRPPPPAPTTVNVPGLGAIDVRHQSLLVTTVVIALVDGVNPCSLWVLTVLLAVILHSRSRRKVALVGMTFLATSAAVYGLFIAGAFGVLSYVGYLPWIQALIALAAVLFAAVNIKDYFAFQHGPSLTISPSQKPRIYRRVRGLNRLMEQGRSTPTLMAGAAVVAVGVSLVEFACTAGFPVLWSSTLAANEVSGAVFVGLLGVYLLLYLVDELVVFGAALATLRAAKLHERHGRLLKLAAGTTMLALAGAILLSPATMMTPGGSLAVFATALLSTVVVVVVHDRVWPAVRMRSARR